MHAAFAKLEVVDEGIRVWGLLLLMFLVGLLPFLVWYSRRSRERNRIILRKWAEQHDLQIIWIRRPWFSKGPFAEFGFEESTYRIEVLDKVGKRKKGWVGCGLSVSDVSVRWDDCRPCRGR